MAIAADTPAGEIARGRGGFMRNAQDTPYITDPDAKPVKSGKRKGEVKRIPYGSPSSRGKLIEDTWALNKYGERRIVMGIGVDLALVADCAAVARLDPETTEYRDAADRVVLRAKDAAKTALAADQGSHTHALSEDHDEERDWIARAEAGENMGIPTNVQAALVDAWRAMLEREGLEILAVEASCVDDRWRLAGTLDRIARTTRDMRFVKVEGEIAVVPAGTVLVLDIKSGKKRTRADGSIMYWAGYSVQIASYAQSVPYDTVTEQRGTWEWEIDQEHALIAHLSVENALAGNPTCELVYVDLVAGREHGGACVVDAKAWSERRDVFSVAQLVDDDATEAAGAEYQRHGLADGGTTAVAPSAPSSASPGLDDPTGDAPAPTAGDPLATVGAETYCRTCDLGGHVCPGCGADTSHEQTVCTSCRVRVDNEDICAAGRHCTSIDAACAAALNVDDHSMCCCFCRAPLTENAGDPHPAGDAGTDTTTGPPPPVVVSPSPTAAEQHAQIARDPDEGGPADPDAIRLLEHRYAQLPDTARAWIKERVVEAQQHHVPLHLKGHQTVRRFELVRAMTILAATLETAA